MRRRLGLLAFALVACDLAQWRELGAARPIGRPRPADPVHVARASVDPELVVAPAGVLAELPPEVPVLATPVSEAPPPAIRVPELDCTPVPESGFRRGKRTPITVVTIDGEKIERATADAYWAMRAAAAADGVELTIFSAFRSDAQQRYFYECYRSCSCNACAQAAKPGYSNHQMGRAVDLAMWPGVHEWLVANAGRFGFVATVPSEPWHWELRRSGKRRVAAACPSG